MKTLTNNTAIVFLIILLTLSVSSQAQTITSVQTGDWNDPNTWDCYCTPDFGSDVIIAPTHNVTVDNWSECNDLTIDATGTLSMVTNQTIDIYQNWYINGSLNLTDGTINLTGPAEQQIHGGNQSVDLHLHNVNINGNDQIVFKEVQAFVLNGTLAPNTGEMVIDPSCTFVVNSTSETTTGRIGEINPMCEISGDVTVKRYIPAGPADYRDICSPVQGAWLSAWDQSIEITGPGFPDGSCGEIGCMNSAKYYADDTYYDIVDYAEELVVCKGYEIFVGDDSLTYAGGTLSVTGELSGFEDMTDSVTAGWEIIGNPYASPILFSELVLDGVADFFYIYDPDIEGFQWYDGSTGTSSIPELTDGLIAMGQSVWMNGPGNVTFSQSAKTGNVATFKEGSTHYGEGIHLTLSNADATQKCIIGFEPGTGVSDGYDEMIDIPHFTLDRIKSSEMAIVLDGELFRKNHFESDGMDKSFELWVDIKKDGIYTITSENISEFGEYNTVLLVDNETGNVIDFIEDSEYVFEATEGESDRFTILLQNTEEVVEEGEDNESGLASIEEDNSGNISLTQMGHSISVNSTYIENLDVQIQLVNVMAQTVIENNMTSINNGQNLIELPTDLKGVFVISIYSEEAVLTQKFVLN